MELLSSLMVFLTSCLLIYDCRELDGYKFPVYTTQSCPENEIEWNSKASAFNCSKESSYACFPNNETTELIEFCYPLRIIIIPEGVCLYLSKKRSELEIYECRGFRHGCPEKQYLGSSIYQYPSCVSLGDGCFVAEPFCNSTKKITEKDVNLNDDQANWWLIVATCLPLLVVVLVIVIILYIMKKGRPVEIITMVKQQENTEELQHLLINGADVNQCDKNGASPLYIACQHGHESTAQLLIDNCANCNLCDKTGVSPLYMAYISGHFSIMQLLLNSGADVNLSDKKGISPFHIACMNGDENTVQLLINNGADVNLQLSHGSGFTPLYLACRHGHAGIVTLLLNNDAKVNLCDKTGASPFYIACQYGHEDIVQLLLSKDADMNLCDKNGVSPYFKACKYGHKNIAQLLLNKGVDRKTGASLFCIAYQKGPENIEQITLGKRET